MTTDDKGPKIQIDSDWKAQAQAEKERLTRKESEKKGSKAASGGAGAGQQGELPEASFKTLVSMLASQAMMGLGVMVDRQSGGVVVDLEGARFSIDLLDVLESKTKGNLSEEEAAELKQLLADLRARFVQISEMVQRQATSGRIGPSGAVSGAGRGEPAGPKLEI